MVIFKSFKARRFFRFSLFGLTIMFISILSSTRVLRSISWGSINGSWQNFNIVRRFLDGQAPFSDFSVYLGYGHLTVLSLPQIFFGNNFTASLVIAYAVVFICFSIFCFSVSKLILKDFYISAFITLSFFYLNLLRPDFFIRFMQWMPDVFMAGFNRGIAPGVSALIIRLVIIPLMVLFLSPFFEKRAKFFREVNYKIEILIAAVSGISIIWSNDGGVSWFLAFSFLYGLLHVKYKGWTFDLLKSAGIYIGCSLLALFLCLTIITYGNPLAYFSQTLGVSSYQGWYFYWLKPSSILDFEFDPFIVAAFGLTILFIYKFLRAKRENKMLLDYFWLSCILLAFCIQNVVYFYSNGTTRNISFLYLSMFFILISFPIKFIRERLARSKISKTKVSLVVTSPNSDNMSLKVNSIQISSRKLFVALLVGFGVISILTVYDRHFTTLSSLDRSETAVHVPTLGGYVTHPDINLLNDAVARVGDETVFSTYAGAFEAMTSQFQPTGIDYIIHVLGDEHRAHYLDIFQLSEHQYVSTIDRRYTSWSDWIIQANWFFHRELFRNYMPVFTTRSHTFWERQLVEQIEPENMTISIERLGESGNQMQIEIFTDEHISGTADIRFGYSINIESVFYNLDMMSSIIWTDRNNQTATGLRPSEEIMVEHKPITIIDGHGRATIYGAPSTNSFLDVYFAEVVQIFPHPFNYAMTSNKTDEDWENGISRTDRSRFIVDSDKHFNVALENAASVRTNNSQEFRVIAHYYDEEYHIIYIDGDASELAFPNVFEILN